MLLIVVVLGVFTVWSAIAWPTADEAASITASGVVREAREGRVASVKTQNDGAFVVTFVDGSTMSGMAYEDIHLILRRAGVVLDRGTTTPDEDRD